MRAVDVKWHIPFLDASKRGFYNHTYQKPAKGEHVHDLLVRKRYQNHTLADRWGRGRDLGVGKEGAGLVRGWFGVRGAEAPNNGRGRSCKVCRRIKLNGEADATGMIPK